jgi:hypothetical protein
MTLLPCAKNPGAVGPSPKSSHLRFTGSDPEICAKPMASKRPAMSVYNDPYPAKARSLRIVDRRMLQWY